MFTVGRVAWSLSSLKTYSLWKSLCLVFDSKMTSLQRDRGVWQCKTKAYFLNTAPEISSAKRVPDACSSLKKCCYTLCLGCRQILAKPDTLWTYNSWVQYVNSTPCFSTCWGPVVDLELCGSGSTEQKQIDVEDQYEPDAVTEKRTKPLTRFSWHQSQAPRFYSHMSWTGKAAPIPVSFLWEEKRTHYFMVTTSFLESSLAFCWNWNLGFLER